MEEAAEGSFRKNQLIKKKLNSIFCGLALKELEEGEKESFFVYIYELK